MQWHKLKQLIPVYIEGDITNGATDLMHLIKEALNDIAIDLPANDENEELYNDLRVSVDVIEACMAGMDLNFDGNNTTPSKQQRANAIKQFKFLANKLSE